MGLNIGDRVFHRGTGCNGLIVAIDQNKQYDKYGIRFSWGKYSKMPLHNLGGRINEPKGIWGSEDEIVLTPRPSTRKHPVYILGNRSLDRVLKSVCRLGGGQFRPNNAISINYGTFRYAEANGFVINRRIVSDKFAQCVRMLSKDCCVPKISDHPFDGCIQKPFHSIGGKNITEYHAGDMTYGYFQKRVNKVREFRAHVALWSENPVPLIQEKTVDDPSQLTWNKKQGGKFTTVYQPHLKIRELSPSLVTKIHNRAICAVKALNYDMGGVDIALDDEGHLWIFEINSRMGVREYTLATYTQIFWILHNLDIDKYRKERWE